MAPTETRAGYAVVDPGGVEHLLDMIRQGLARVAGEDAEAILASSFEIPPLDAFEVADGVYGPMEALVREMFGQQGVFALLKACSPIIRRACAAEPPKPPEVAGGDPVAKVLLTHGNDRTRTEAARLLVDADYEVDGRADNTAALGQAIKVRPDIVVCGVNAAPLEGAELCQLLRSAYGGDAPPCVLLGAVEPNVAPGRRKPWAQFVSESALHASLVPTMTLVAYA